MTRKEQFLSDIKNAYELARDLELTGYEMIMKVSIEMPDLPEKETIMNPIINFQGKHDYYEKAYNDDLELISFPKIKIFQWSFDSKKGQQM
jgi:hypothetical protein